MNVDPRMGGGVIDKRANQNAVERCLTGNAHLHRPTLMRSANKGQVPVHRMERWINPRMLRMVREKQRAMGWNEREPFR